MLLTMAAARINIGLSQIEAAKLFNVHYQTLAKWEDDNSKMPYEAIAKIPKIYGVDSNYIFFGKQNEFIRLMRNKIGLTGIEK